MVTLHIEHAITDFATWSNAFDRFAQYRRGAGVRREKVSRPSDDERYVVIDLDFETADMASNFEHFLKSAVWTDSTKSPALQGTPHTRILRTEHEFAQTDGVAVP